MLGNYLMSASISLRPQISRKFPSRTRVKLPIHPSSFGFHPSSAPLSPQTPSLPGADPRSGRPRCAGRESNFLTTGMTDVLPTELDDFLREFRGGRISSPASSDCASFRLLSDLPPPAP